MAKFDIQEKDQFQFNELEPKHLNNFASQVWIIDEDKEAVVFRQLTKTGIISKNKSKQFVLSFEEIEEHGTKLSSEGRVYPDLPKDLEKVLAYLESEGMSVSRQRKQFTINTLTAHNTELMNTITELQDRAERVQELIKEYQDSLDSMPEPEEEVLELDDEIEALSSVSDVEVETEEEANEDSE